MNCGIIVIGASQGGLDALENLFRNFTTGIAPPIVLAYHRNARSGPALKTLLDKRLPFPAIEPDDKEPIRAGRFYLAPADYHLLVDEERFHLSTGEPVHLSRPSIDVLFESAAFAFKDRAVGVILTGANSDGAEGSSRIAEQGGLVLVQDPQTAMRGAMPEAAIKQVGKNARVLTLADIGAAIAHARTIRKGTN